MIIGIAEKPSYIQYPPHLLPPRKKNVGLFTIRGFSILLLFLFFIFFAVMHLLEKIVVIFFFNQTRMAAFWGLVCDTLLTFLQHRPRVPMFCMERTSLATRT